MIVACETWQRGQRTSPAAGSYMQPFKGPINWKQKKEKMHQGTKENNLKAVYWDLWQNLILGAFCIAVSFESDTGMLHNFRIGCCLCFFVFAVSFNLFDFSFLPVPIVWVFQGCVMSSCWYVAQARATIDAILISLRVRPPSWNEAQKAFYASATIHALY